MHGAHRTKCYFLLRGLARVLTPENDPTNPGGVSYCYGSDIGPGEVRKIREGFHVKGLVLLLIARVYCFVGFLVAQVFACRADDSVPTLAALGRFADRSSRRRFFGDILPRGPKRIFKPQALCVDAFEDL